MRAILISKDPLSKDALRHEYSLNPFGGGSTPKAKTTHAAIHLCGLAIRNRDIYRPLPVHTMGGRQTKVFIVGAIHITFHQIIERDQMPEQPLHLPRPLPSLTPSAHGSAKLFDSNHNPTNPISVCNAKRGSGIR